MEIKAPYQLVQSNFDMWNAALQTGDPKKVASLYAEGALFLPTFDNNLYIGPKQAEKYLKNFLLKEPVGEIIKDGFMFTSPNTYNHMGLYDFTVGPKEERSRAHAKFTYTWQQNDSGIWKILLHHSSPLA